MDMTMAKLVSGEPCDGMLGMDFFGSKIVSINFDDLILSLPDDVPEENKKAANVVTIKSHFAHYTADVLLNEKVTVILRLDTGDSGSLSLNKRDWQKAFSTDSLDVRTATVAGVGTQAMKTEFGRIEKMTVGSLSYTNLHAFYIQNPSDISHLGLNFFRRHVVTFDFVKQKLYLQPGKNFSVQDEHDMHLLRINGLTVVHSVDENSPAFNAGVKAQDVILSVNGQNSLSMKSIREMLESENGKKIILEVQRDGNSWKSEFVLKDNMR